SKYAYVLGDDYSLTKAGENPSPAAFPAIGSSDSLVYLIGGERAEDGPFTNPSSGVMVYNIATESWAKCTDFPTSIAYSGAAMSHDSLFVVGGSASKNPGEIFSDKFYLGIVTNDSTISWSQLPNLPIAVTGGKCALINSDLFFFGGYSANGLSGKVWKYSFQSGVWMQETSAPIGLAQTSNFFALGNVLYVAGGISSKSILSYEAKTGSISVSPLIPQVGSVTLSDCCLSVRSQSDRRGSLVIYNIKGEVEFRASIEPQSLLSINKEELVSGVHIVEFKSNGKRWIQRILV
ncbi:MAG: Kelch repeat-containing protein, partial [Candidatus Kapaibacterium sp.]